LKVAPVSFDVAELFTDSVRHAMPLALDKALHVSFDHHGPLVTASGDGAALGRAFERLWAAAIDLVDSGFLVFYAHMQAHRPGKCVLKVKAAGTGLAAPATVVDAVLRRLGFAEDGAGSEHGRMRLRRAEGQCPYTGVAVEFASLPLEGVLLSAEWQLPIVHLVAPTPVLQMPGPAWVVHDDVVVAESLMRRLARLGWDTTRFDAPLPAQRRLRALEGHGMRPALLIALEGAGVTPDSVQCLRPWLPDGRLVYGACEGSPACLGADAVPGFEVRAMPFAPAELEAFGLGVPMIVQARLAGT
jgi:hypothetical protein